MSNQPQVIQVRRLARSAARIIVFSLTLGLATSCAQVPNTIASVEGDSIGIVSDSFTCTIRTPSYKGGYVVHHDSTCAWLVDPSIDLAPHLSDVHKHAELRLGFRWDVTLGGEFVRAAAYQEMSAKIEDRAATKVDGVPLRVFSSAAGHKCRANQFKMIPPETARALTSVTGTDLIAVIAVTWTVSAGRGATGLGVVWVELSVYDESGDIVYLGCASHAAFRTSFKSFTRWIADEEDVAKWVAATNMALSRLLPSASP